VKFRSFSSFLLACIASLSRSLRRRRSHAGPEPRWRSDDRAGRRHVLRGGGIDRSPFRGGRTPYSVTSSDPTLLPVPPIVNGHSFQVVPNNPGVRRRRPHRYRRTAPHRHSDRSRYSGFTVLGTITSFALPDTATSCPFGPTTCPTARWSAPAGTLSCRSPPSPTGRSTATSPSSSNRFAAAASSSTSTAR